MPAEWFSRPAPKSLCLSCSCILGSLPLYVSVFPGELNSDFQDNSDFPRRHSLLMWTWLVGFGVLSFTPTPIPCPTLLRPFHAPWSVGCKLYCLHVLREKLHQEWSGVKGLARHGVTWKTRQQKQEGVASAGVNPMSTCPSSFIPKALACLLLFPPPLAVLHGKHFSSPLPTAET